jgi:hypothetical protein
MNKQQEKGIKRRIFLKTAGAALAITGVSGAFWANTRTPTRALEPWKQAAIGFGDMRIDALAYALLSPSPHNRQPWQVNLVKEDIVELYCDLDRRLPHTDPFDRQILIGLGCFSELLVMAAANKGYTAHVALFPDGEPAERLDARRIATFRFEKTSTTSDPLFDQALKRRSIKETFDVSQPVTDAILATLLSASNAASGTNQTLLVDSINNMAFEAMRIEFLTPQTLRESAELMRIGKAQIEANPDGIDIGGAAMELLNKTGMLTQENFANAKSAMVADYLAGLEARYMSTNGYVWITTASNSRREQFEAGRHYIRLNLQATKIGISMHPVSQILQEYKEMDRLLNKIHRDLGVAQPARLQMLARVGYGPVVAETPRWPVETIVKGA